MTCQNPSVSEQNRKNLIHCMHIDSRRPRIIIIIERSSSYHNRDREMKSGKDAEGIRKAVKQLIEEEDDDDDDDDDGTASLSHESQILPKLLSELDSLEESSKAGDESEQETHLATDKPSNANSNEEIMKEIKKLKRQNMITQSLLTVMIVLTLTWQLSEVSLILKIKDGLSNPLKSVAGMMRGFLKKPPAEVNVQDAINNVSAGNQKQVAQPASSLPGLKIPQLPSLQFPGFDDSDKED